MMLGKSLERWQKSGGITRADLIEEFANNLQPSNTRYNEGIQLLEEALKLKANAGGAIKKTIREYIESIK